MNTLLQNSLNLLKHNFKEQSWKFNHNRAAVRLQIQDSLKISPTFKTNLEELKNNGITVFSINKLANGSNILERMLVEYQEGYIASSKNTASNLFKDYLLIFQPWNEIPDYQNALVGLSLHPEILALVNNYMGMCTKVMNMAYWHTLISHNKAKSSQIWHRDYEDFKVIKVFIYLNDVEEKSGPFHYIPKTHKGINRCVNPVTFKDEEGGIRANDNDINIRYSKLDKIPILGKQGTIIIADTKGFHKGGLCLNQERKLAYISYKSPSYKKKGLAASIQNLPSNSHPIVQFAARGN